MVTLKNPKLIHYIFLENMVKDPYFPPALVIKGQEILKHLCEAIENQKPASLDALYTLTHTATEKFNELNEEMQEQGSDIETMARECIGADIATIATAYGFDQADIEELIAPRDW